VGQYQKGKTNLDFTEARDSEWQWHQLGHMQDCTSLQTDNHASTPPLSYLQAGCPILPPNQQCQSTEGKLLFMCLSVCLCAVNRKRPELSAPKLVVITTQTSKGQGLRVDEEHSLHVVDVNMTAYVTLINHCGCPVWALGHNVPLIRFFISVLYILFACLYRMLPHVPFFLNFFLLISSLTYLFL